MTRASYDGTPPARRRAAKSLPAASPVAGRAFGVVLLLAASLAGWSGSAFTLGAAFGASVLPDSPPLPAALVLQGVTVGIDPGHGGYDPGVLLNEDQPNEVRESDINLAVALRLRDILERAGATVVMTRTTDVDCMQPGDAERYGGPARADLSRRMEAVVAGKADLFISIHCNAFPQSQWRGAQAFYLAEGGPESRRLAEIIQGELVRVTRETERLANRRAGLFLLKIAPMPAVTVELGFLSNPRDLELLQNPDYQHLCAIAIFFAICRYTSLAPVGPA